MNTENDDWTHQLLKSPTGTKIAELLISNPSMDIEEAIKLVMKEDILNTYLDKTPRYHGIPIQIINKIFILILILIIIVFIIMFFVGV